MICFKRVNPDKFKIRESGRTFEYTSKILEKEQYVEPTFREAVTSREVVFPTGLEMNGIKIAIPHTDTIYVKRPFVLVNKLSTPIPFIQMGTTDKWIDVEVIFMLGIKIPKIKFHCFQVSWRNLWKQTLWNK